MSEAKQPLPQWPFIVGNVIFLGLAAAVMKFGHRPLSWQEASLVVLCGGLGAFSFLWPYARRNADDQTRAQIQLLADSMAQFKNLEHLTALITGATNQWLEYQVNTTKTNESVKALADGMAAEVKAFRESLHRAGETEKAHLRVEADKLRRADGERLQLIVHILDHIFALSQAAQRSGQPQLIEQIAHFQKACLGAAQRVGLVQTTAEVGAAYDDQLHQLLEDVKATEHALVAGTIAAGYNYQGQVLRRPAVSLRE
jgi:molecular chaperone GrpE (heat shock protein)